MHQILIQDGFNINYNGTDYNGNPHITVENSGGIHVYDDNMKSATEWTYYNTVIKNNNVYYCIWD